MASEGGAGPKEGVKKEEPGSEETKKAEPKKVKPKHTRSAFEYFLPDFKKTDGAKEGGVETMEKAEKTKAIRALARIQWDSMSLEDRTPYEAKAKEARDAAKAAAANDDGATRGVSSKPNVASAAAPTESCEEATAVVPSDAKGWDELRAQFYTAEEAKQLSKGTRLQAADKNGQWATGAVLCVVDTAVKLRWVGFGAAQGTVPFVEAPTRLCKAKTPEQALDAAAALAAAIAARSTPEEGLIPTSEPTTIMGQDGTEILKPGGTGDLF